MSAKSVGIGGLVALAGLALLAVIATNPLSIQASSSGTPTIHDTEDSPLEASAEPSELGKPDRVDLFQGADGDSDDSSPFIGVVIQELEDGSVKVVRVLVGGPSHGVLMTGDLITAVDGTTIAGTEDIVDAIEVAGSGTAITLTITRDGSSQTVDITVGERPQHTQVARTYKSSKSLMPSKASPGRLRIWEIRSDPTADSRAVRTEIVYENEDGGYSTYRAVLGTVSDLDSTAGTFTLNPKDGSDSIDYTIDQDTRVIMNRSGDLGQLNSDDDTLVIDTDVEVMLVHQGEPPRQRGHFYKQGRRFWPNDGNSWRGSGGLSTRQSTIENVLESLRSQIRDRT